LPAVAAQLLRQPGDGGVELSRVGVDQGGGFTAQRVALGLELRPLGVPFA
jgi:hypothetical protein